MLSGVLLMIFLLPADSGEKVSLGVSVLVAISVFLLLVAGNVPDTSDAIPIIGQYNISVSSSPRPWIDVFALPETIQHIAVSSSPRLWIGVFALPKNSTWP